MARDRLSVTLHRGAEILSRISRTPWQALADQAEDSPYFLQYDMIAGYLGHLRAGAQRAGEPLALELRRDGQLVGVLVLEQDTVNASGLNLPALCFVVHPHAPQSDLLLSPAASLQEFWPLILAELSRHRVRWQVIRWPAARTSSAAWRHATGSSLQGQVIAAHVDHADYFDCTRGYEAIEAAYGASLKRRLGQANRQLARMGVIEYTSFRAADPGGWDAFDQFIALEGAGWKAAEGTAVRQSEGLLAHYRQFYALNTPKAWAEVHLMRLDGKVIAAQFCIVSGRIREVVKLAYDETLRKQSPGNVMLDHMLRLTCEDTEVSRFGLVGRPPWLAEWSPSTHEVHEVLLFRRRTVARLVALSARLKRAARDFVKTKLRRGAAPSVGDAPAQENSSAEPPASSANPAGKLPIEAPAPSATSASQAMPTDQGASARRASRPEDGEKASYTKRARRAVHAGAGRDGSVDVAGLASRPADTERASSLMP